MNRLRTCMATVSIGGSLDEKLGAIARSGFDGIELLDDDLHRSGMSPTACARRCADLGLSIDLYQPFRRAEGVPTAAFADVVTRFRVELAVMQELGADAILIVSNTDADADASRDGSAEQLAALGDAAAEHGMTVMFEALAWGTHINRVSDAHDVIRRANHPNLSLVVDTFHLLARDGETLDRLPHGAVGFLQIADAPRLSLDLLQWSRGHRCLPGEGEFDLVTPIASVLSAGYRGPLSLEIFNPGYRERSPIEVAQHAAASLRALAERVGAALGTDPVTTAAPVITTARGGDEASS